jgi:folate-binding protein YgfZ
MDREVVNPLERLIAEGAPAQVSSLEHEYAAALEGCAVFPAWYRAVARATGEDSESFLHGMLSNDVRKLAIGHGLPAAFLTDTGKVVSDLRVYRDEEGFDLDCASWRLDHLCAGLDKYIIADDIEIERLNDRCALVGLEGPSSGEVATAVFGVGELSPYAGAAAELAGRPVFLHAVSDVGGRGVLVIGPAALRDDALEACRAAGAVGAGVRALDVLRVEAGIPWAGIDMDEDTLLMEIGLDETISRTKGCYLGQEVVERVSARGQVNRTLTAFAIDAPYDALPNGTLDVRGDGDAVVGRITSRVLSPRLGGVLGMGLLHRKGHDAAALHIAAGDGAWSCRAVEFPGARAS